MREQALTRRSPPAVNQDRMMCRVDPAESRKANPCTRISAFAFGRGGPQSAITTNCLRLRQLKFTANCRGTQQRAPAASQKSGAPFGGPCRACGSTLKVGHATCASRAAPQARSATRLPAAARRPAGVALASSSNGGRPGAAAQGPLARRQRADLQGGVAGLE